MMATDQYPPLQLKGEIMDLDFTMDTDHRKRRRNRTTQSCLNCHTSKRKCDRKRPCQRCIQLGLTGLCVYEIDDPALRDDPTIDETTRLRNRIAELESLVRELRGKPHPRWADSSFRDGDPTEKWHSRATKCLPANKRRLPSPELVQDQSNSNGSSTHSRIQANNNPMLTPIKTESSSEPSHLFRFSPSPAPSIRYHNFQTDVGGGLRSPTSTSSNSSPYEVGPASSSSSSRALPPSSYRSTVATNNGGPYHHHPHHHPSSPYSAYSDTGANSTAYHQLPDPGNDPGIVVGVGGGGGGGGNAGPVDYTRTSPPPLSSSSSSSSPSSAPVGPYSSHSLSLSSALCTCHTNPVLSSTYISLSQQLENTVHTIRQYHHHHNQQHHHHHHEQCQLYRSILELNSLMQGIDISDVSHSPYDSSTTPTESEILTPLSAASSNGPPSSAFQNHHHHHHHQQQQQQQHPGHHHPHHHHHSLPGLSSSSSSTSPGTGGGGGAVAASPQEWASYNSYFPVSGAAEHGLYGHIVS
ncbi:hypothetical protein D9757_007899 [Collybiopsis confluens]|uniref:Zn(2)-C6 fungal-type domain-containing protein n=1 Tax=Collybiopsis confluens TaxID=2823264 RepID=A0A8H5HDJ8_9AGAR|nr:hypothetical protein D9757_007899 [Collybiopsis confluens]